MLYRHSMKAAYEGTFEQRKRGLIAFRRNVAVNVDFGSVIHCLVLHHIVTFHGSGFPYMGNPLTTACALRMPGGKTIASYLERKPPAPEGVAATVCVLM